MDKITNNLPNSINIKQFKNAKLTKDEQAKVMSIFNEVDNSYIDKDKKKGIISGQEAIQYFWTNLKSRYGELYSKIKDSSGSGEQNEQAEEAQNGIK